jgi:hypothetical protein
MFRIKAVEIMKHEFHAKYTFSNILLFKCLNKRLAVSSHNLKTVGLILFMFYTGRFCSAVLPVLSYLHDSITI